MRREMEMMRILRVPPMGKMVVEIQKHRFESLAELGNDEKAIRIINTAIGELVSFAGGYQALVDAGVAPALAPPPEPVKEEVTLTAQQAEFLAQLEAEQAALRNPELDETAVSTGSRQAVSSPTPTPSPEPEAAPAVSTKSVVEQIDDVLQELVGEAEEFNGRSLHIVQNPAGGVSIDVDGKRYPNPNAVEDPIAQALVTKAIKQWENA